MGYRDDFYTADNIIGYTGDINNNPTVYFRSEKDGEVTFGRITQEHKDDFNVGREEVRKAKDYDLKDAWVHHEGKGNYTLESDHDIVAPGKDLGGEKLSRRRDGKFIMFEYKAVEIWDGKVQHVSRGTLNSVSPREKKILEAAIGQKKELKLKFQPKEKQQAKLKEDAPWLYEENTKIEPKTKPKPLKIISKKKAQELQQAKLSGKEKMAPKTKSTPDKEVDENVLNVLSSGKARKLAQKQDLSKDPKLKKPLVQNQKFDVEDLASPGFRKNKRAKQNTRSTSPNKSGDNKTRQTRQRRRSSMGPS